MSRSQWVQARQTLVFVMLFLLTWPAMAGSTLPQITFTPVAPTGRDAVTAVLPFQVCAWTVVATPAHLDINYMLAPCAQTFFTDHIPLGTLAPGTYTVALNMVPLQQGPPIPQALGTLGVAVAVAPTPAVGPWGLWLAALCLVVLGWTRLGTRPV
jgi:hypothetical protein